jgi:hypothetical protein
MRSGDGFALGFLALFLIVMTGLISGEVTHENDQHTAFKLKCGQSNGTVTETRNTDFCFNGNVLLFKMDY